MSKYNLTRPGISFAWITLGAGENWIGPVLTGGLSLFLGGSRSKGTLTLMYVKTPAKKRK